MNIRLTHTEQQSLNADMLRLMRQMRDSLSPDDFAKLKRLLRVTAPEGSHMRDSFGIPVAQMVVSTALTLIERLSADRNMVLTVLIYRKIKDLGLTEQQVRADWSDDIANMVRGLIKVAELYERSPAVANDNFRKLLLTLAEDIRVIIITIVARLALMRMINHHPDEDRVKEVALEARYLYSQLAHRLGLYSIKSELEDMSLKYTERDTYTKIAHQLNSKKAERDAYMEAFMRPVREQLEQTGLKFEMKGRTKSIYSIWNKMKKQQNDLDHIYDLFAIRVILDSPRQREKGDCWTVYSIITDMYQPNPSRMKDWLSIPKSNGYESLHITVRGPEGKWVEVQIRSRRMDEIAERGLAAHWKYKGVKAEDDLDAWMNNVRDILEAADSDPMGLMRNLKMDVYDSEVFVFTPKGDLYKLPLGASLLDFAFNIHSKLGCSCTGGRVNGKNQKLNYKLQSGDTVEILTSTQQTPKADWLNFTVTSKARSKIRQAIKEQSGRAGELGKELLLRRLKNRKIEADEGQLMKLIKKSGFKTVTDFYIAISNGDVDINAIIEQYVALEAKNAEPVQPAQSAEAFTVNNKPDDDRASDDVLVIGDNIKGLNYRLAKCCNPIYGDDVFGFVSAEGVIKVHRADCPNARNIRQKYPYRVIPTRWSGKIGSEFGATLRIVGKDDIGIVTNITSLINKEKSTSLRSISIDSHDGLFQGFLVVGVSDALSLNQLIKKIKTVKGVKDVERSK